ncbi:MAG TPA: response regulator [Candidatus Dormibacteraeota bacterium]
MIVMDVAGMKLLIVEDDPAIADVYAFPLRLAGYDVEIAPDGEAALVALESNPPAMMLLDIRLPKLDGLQVLERLRAAGNNLPVVVLSNHMDGETIRRAYALGALEYLIKSQVTPSALRSRLPELLAS